MRKTQPKNGEKAPKRENNAKKGEEAEMLEFVFKEEENLIKS